MQKQQPTQGQNQPQPQQQQQQQQQQEQQQRKQDQQEERRKPLDGGGGPPSGGGGGPTIPDPPEGQDLLEFLEYSLGAVGAWAGRTRSDAYPEFEIADSELRALIGDAWVDLTQKWQTHRADVAVAIKQVEISTINVHGLAGPMMQFKLEIVRRSASALKSAVQQREQPSPLTVRSLWRRLFESIDVVLDSVAEVMPPAGIAAAMVGGLREFKDAAMTVSRDERD